MKLVTVSFRLRLTVLVLFVSALCLAQTFTEQTGIILHGIEYSSGSWGDYDNDGDLDILITGQYINSLYTTVPISRIYRNNGDNTFTEQTGLIPREKAGASAWGDYDNDGNLDVIITGAGVASIFHNNGNNSFTEQTSISLIGTESSSIAWGDYDNDGDLDVLGVSNLFRNNGDNHFTKITNSGLAQVSQGCVSWGDYDNDGDLDVLVMGYLNPTLNCLSILYRNNGDNSFTEQTGIKLMGVEFGSAAWGDYDNDGDLDLALAGKSGDYGLAPDVTIIYRNNAGNSFTEQTGIVLTGIQDGNVAWGDYDNDGDLDLLLCGENKTKVYRNNGDNSFTDQTDIVLSGVDIGSVAWGDYDNDGDLDILSTGRQEKSVSKIYRNDGVKQNKRPGPPTFIQQVVSGRNAVLSWKPVDSDETLSKSMSYDVKVVRQSDSVTITPIHSTNDGIRKTVSMGNAQLDTTYTLKNLKRGTYNWSVQAVDNGFKGGSFSTEGTFTITAMDQAHGLTVANLNGTSAVFNWDRGSLSRCIVFVKEGTGNMTPIDHTKYVASAILEQGSVTVDGWSCVYDGIGETASVSGLTGGKSYSAQIFEYEYISGEESYLKTTVSDNLLTFKTRPFDQKNGFSNEIWHTSDWGDYDNDGDLDVIIESVKEWGETRLFRNDGNFMFTEQKGLGMRGIKSGTVVWGDYNNDGFLDILLAGRIHEYYQKDPAQDCAKLYRNNGNNSFTEISTSFSKDFGSHASFADYDNDGDLDVFVAGITNSKIFRNNGDNSFTEQTNISMTGAMYAAAAWGDYNNDGFIDLLLTGEIGSKIISKIYRNNGNNSFTEQTDISLIGVRNGSVAWGDYDKDGDLDILLTGENFLKVYHNNGKNGFTEQCSISFVSSSRSSAAWGDFDNDGDLDILFTGSGLSKLYRNNGDKSFTEQTDCVLEGTTYGNVNWGDFDYDGDLDIFIIGVSRTNIYSRFYCNELTNAKSIPDNSPIGLSHQVSGSEVTLKWKPFSSQTIPPKALSYNVSVMPSVGSSSIIPAHTAESGLRYVSRMGNARLDTTFILKNLKEGTYYWKVQTVDNSFQGSAYSQVDTFTILPAIQANNLQTVNLDGSNAILRWKRGNCENCVVFIKEGNGNVVPVNSTTYQDSTIFGKGSMAGDGWYCVYNGKSDFISISGLKGLTTYTFQVFEYDGASGSEQYLVKEATENPYTFKSLNFCLQSDISLPRISLCSNEWGDYDNDGDLDILITGFSGYSRITKIYRNNGNNNFTEQTNIMLAGVEGGSATWGDYDNDGDLDILLTGYNISGNVSKIYRNNGNNSFSEQTNMALPGAKYGKWGDYDNDGDLDILLTGYSTSGNISKIFRNNGNSSFTEQTNISFKGNSFTVGAWRDYDNDGDLDLILTGSGISKVYRNNGENNFEEQSTISLPGLYRGSVEWGDYDKDGDLDLLLSGATTISEYGIIGNGITKVYRNNGDNSFTEQTDISLIPLCDASVKWGDYDNDGYLDILMTGWGSSKIYRNNCNGNFTMDPDFSLSGVTHSAVAWGDYDNDGDLDFLLDNLVYRNFITSKSSSQAPNKKTLSPKNLIAQKNGNGIHFSWEGDATDETPKNALSYNIAIGKTKGSMFLGPPQSLNAVRSVVSMGNTGLNNFYNAKIDSAKYYWSVQAVDGGFQGGTWSAIDSFTINIPVQASSLSASLIDGSSAQLNWERGSCEKCVVFVKEGTGNNLPVNKTTYVASTVFGPGSSIGDGWYCVYNGSNSNVKISGLNGLTNYTFKVYEYNGATGFEQYLTSLSSSPFTFKTLNFSLQSGISLPAITNGSTAWGDYDQDGDLDILLTGLSGSRDISRIYRNNGNNSFSDQTGISLVGVEGGTATWGDYDNDGDLDILLTGDDGSDYISKVYRNNGNNNFSEQTGISLIRSKSGYWADYDSDGYLDILLSGIGVTKIYRNEKNGGFTEQSDISLPGLTNNAAAWGDYDNDGDLDLILSGSLSNDLSGPFISKLYRNDGGNRFIEQTDVSLEGVCSGSVAWGDYDNDGDLDLLFSGATTYTTIGNAGWGNGISKVHRNNGDGSFTEQTDNTLSPMCLGTVAWGDFDNDGDLDILMSGYDNSTFFSKIFKNNSTNSLTEIPDYSLMGSDYKSVAWGDYDNDGDLDFLSDGLLFRNFLLSNGSVQGPNKKPLSPKNLTVQKNGNEVLLNWQGDETDETPQKALSYNVALGKTKGNMLFSTPNSFGNIRTVVLMGNTGLNNFYKLKVDSADYYWAVQAIDGGFKAGEWSVVDSFNIQSTESQMAEYAVYPNPVFNILTIKCLNTLESQIGIYSLNGELKKMGTMKESSFNMDLSKLPQGIYFVKIVNVSGSTFKKIIKIDP